jgi:hypothetical protein
MEQPFPFLVRSGVPQARKVAQQVRASGILDGRNALQSLQFARTLPLQFPELPVAEILSNVVDQSLLGGEYRWSKREHFRCWLRLEHLGLAVGKLDTGFDQSDEVR